MRGTTVATPSFMLHDDDAPATVRDPLPFAVTEPSSEEEPPTLRLWKPRPYRAITRTLCSNVAAPPLVAKLSTGVIVLALVTLSLVLPAFLVGCGSENDSSSDVLPTSDAPPSRGSARSPETGSPAAPKPSSSAPSGSAPAPTPSSSPSASPSPSPSSSSSPPPASPCANSVPVYAFVDGTDAWRYSVDPTPPAGFTAAGVAFRLPSPSAIGLDRDLYLLANAADGDWVVSQKSTEGADLGYAPVEPIGRGFSQPMTGTVALVRYYQTVPRLRHRVSLEPLGDEWLVEPVRGYVCPK